MAKWLCYGAVTGTKYLGTVEAATKKEAEKAAWELPTAHVSVCHQCSGEVEDPDIDSVIVEQEESHA